MTTKTALDWEVVETWQRIVGEVTGWRYGKPLCEADIRMNARHFREQGYVDRERVIAAFTRPEVGFRPGAMPPENVRLIFDEEWPVEEPPTA
jgi:hypothetical protein